MNCNFSLLVREEVKLRIKFRQKSRRVQIALELIYSDPLTNMYQESDEYNNRTAVLLVEVVYGIPMAKDSASGNAS